jgi:periplasmic protein TonB
MPEAGFLAQKRRSPTGFILVVAGHAAALTAWALYKVPQYLLPPTPPIKLIRIYTPPPPPPNPVEQPPRPQPSTLTVPPTPLPPLPSFPTIPEQPAQTQFDPRPIADEPVRIARVEVPRPVIRRDAEMVMRDLQPPYPTAEIRAQRDGSVRVRVTIGTDGRVIAVERLSATSDAFWRATREHALGSWRFRPATEDGRPVQTTRVMTVTFRIGEA